MIQYLTADDIRSIHEVALERYGGIQGEHEPGQINFMADKPSQSLSSGELYSGLFLKAAIYFHGIATRQFFADGNKRTAYLTCAVFLKLNGFSLIVSDEKLYNTAMNVANGRYSESDLAVWLEKHSVR